MEYWKRNLFFMWICQFLAMLGMSSIVPFLPLYIKELGVNSVESASIWSGIAFSGPFFLSLLLTPIWGNIGDRHGRKLMTIRAIFGLAIAQIFVGLSQNVYQLVAARVFQGALSGFIPSSQALIVSNTPNEKTGYALGILQTAISTGTVLGPFFGGFISDLTNYRFVFFLVSILLFLTGIFLIIYVKEFNKPSEKSQKYSVLSNFSFSIKNEIVKDTLVFIFLTSLGFAIIRPVYALYFTSFQIKTELVSTLTGVTYGVSAIFTAISSPKWGKLVSKNGYKKYLAYSAFFVSLAYLLHYFIPSYIYLYPIRALLGLGFGGLLPIFFTIISNNVKNERKGGIMSIGSSFQIIGNIAGPIIGGYIASGLGVRHPFLFSSLIFFTLLMIIIRKVNY